MVERFRKIELPDNIKGKKDLIHSVRDHEGIVQIKGDDGYLLGEIGLVHFDGFHLISKDEEVRIKYSDMRTLIVSEDYFYKKGIIPPFEKDLLIDSD